LLRLLPPPVDSNARTYAHRSRGRASAELLHAVPSEHVVQPGRGCCCCCCCCCCLVTGPCGEAGGQLSARREPGR
jgi:streptolysin S family bacteriocin protoxin